MVMFADAADLKPLIAEAATAMLRALADKSHEISKTPDAAKKALTDGVESAKQGQYEGALKHFAAASTLDARYVAPRILSIKAMKATGQDLEALVMGGFALSIAKDPHDRCMIYNYFGEIAMDLFRLTKADRYFDQAISFWVRAAAEDVSDVIPHWNLVAGNLEARSEVTGRGPSSKAGKQHAMSAEAAFTELLVRARKVDPSVAKGLRKVLADANEYKRQGRCERLAWWDGYLQQLRRSSDDQNTTEVPSDARLPSAAQRSKTRKAVLVAIVLAALAGVARVAGADSAPPSSHAVSPTLSLAPDAGPAQRTPQPTEGTHRVTPRPPTPPLPTPKVGGMRLHAFSLGADGKLAATVTHDWDDVKTTVEHDWDDAARGSFGHGGGRGRSA